MIVLEWRFLTIAPCDAAEPWQLGSQDAATPMMQGIIDLHHDIFFFLILILVFVSRILVRALWHFHYKKNPIPQRIVHGTTIEILRTIFPSIIPMFIAIPSFALLYSMDEVVVDPAITIKAIGHQWYRTYEYSDYNSSDEQSLTFDSYTIPEDDPELGQSRLLEVDNRVVVPAKTHLRIIVTPADVPHSWAVPSSGVKCDAVPGRLNQTSISVQPKGVYYGQCSEICGTNHAFTRAPGVFSAFIVLCDGQTSSPPVAPDLNPPVQPGPDVPGGEPNEMIIAPVVIPELHPPLLPDMLRRVELQERLSLSFVGRNTAAHLPLFLGILEKQMLIEKRVEAALIHDGYNPLSVLAKRHEIRGIIFYPRGTSLSEPTLSRHINQIQNWGTRESIPYRKIMGALRAYNISL
nr:cytochrome c oxidase subunit 2 [Camellia nitidissima]UXP75798.1 cytochrome c oxidase subunit 2 [Camellia nitidissima]